MRKIIWIGVGLLCWAYSLAMAAQPDTSAEEVHYQERAARDAGILPLSAIAREHNMAWIVANVSPGPDSGKGLTRDMYIDGETGKFVEGPNAAFVRQTNGTLSITTILGIAPPESNYAYSWDAPWYWGDPERPAGTGYDALHLLYSPYWSGGEIICKVHPGAAGPSEFEQTCLLARGWSKYVTKAVDYARAHPGLFSPGPPTPDQAALKRLFNDPNPLLAVAAIHAALAEGSLETGEILDIVRHTSGVEQAAIVLLLLKNSGEQRVTLKDALKGNSASQPVVRSLREAVAQASDARSVIGIALGASAKIAEGRGPMGWEGGVDARNLLCVIQVRAAKWPAGTPGRAELLSLLHAAGFTQN